MVAQGARVGREFLLLQPTPCLVRFDKDASFGLPLIPSLTDKPVSR